MVDRVNATPDPSVSKERLAQGGVGQPSGGSSKSSQIHVASAQNADWPASETAVASLLAVSDPASAGTPA
jgi:hypothetical protein